MDVNERADNTMKQLFSLHNMVIRPDLMLEHLEHYMNLGVEMTGYRLWFFFWSKMVKC